MYMIRSVLVAHLTSSILLNPLKIKKIIFDSGMFDGNTRNYSQFRGSYFWNELITEEY